MFNLSELAVLKSTLLFMITMATALFNMQSSFANTEKINQRIQSLPNELKPKFIDKTPIPDLDTLSNIRGSIWIDAFGRYRDGSRTD